MHLRYLFSFQDPNAVKLSRLEILRRTCKYIVFLMKMIDFLKQEAEEREQQQQYQVQEPLAEGHYLMQQQHLMEDETFLVPVAAEVVEPTIRYTTDAIIIEL